MLRRSSRVHGLSALLALSLTSCVGPTSGEAHPSPAPAGPIAELAQRLLGSWRVELANGWRRETYGRSWYQHDTWRLGPGGHSLHGLTLSSNGDGETNCGVLRVIFWDEATKGTYQLALLSRDRLTDTQIEIDGDTATFSYQLWDPSRPPNQLLFERLDWAFDSPGEYRISRIAAIHLLDAWTYERTADPGPPRSGEAPESESARRLSEFTKLAGSWETSLAEPMRREGGTLFQTSVAWIPFADAVHVRVETMEHKLVFEAYAYLHPATGGVHVLGFTKDDPIVDGVLDRRPEGDWQFRCEVGPGSNGLGSGECFGTIVTRPDGPLNQTILIPSTLAYPLEITHRRR